MSNLRSKIIRLAYSNPEMRGDLLPLLDKEAAMYRLLDGTPASYADMVKAAVGKMIVMMSGKFHYTIVQKIDGDTTTEHKVTPTQWHKANLKDLTTERTKEKVAQEALSLIVKKMSIRDRVDWSTGLKELESKGKVTKADALAWTAKKFKVKIPHPTKYTS